MVLHFAPEFTGDPNLLVLSTPPGLTAKWLAPRLYRFSAACPGIEVRVSSALRLADFVTDGVDVAIRNMAIGAEAGPGLVVHPLATVEVLPVCSPSLIERLGPFNTPSDLANVPLIQDDTMIAHANLPSWSDWFAAAGAPEAAHAGSLGFNSPDHALDAAAEGAGVFLAQTILAHDDLKSGRLIAPFGLALETGRAYCVVYPEAIADRSAVAAFRDWALAEIADMTDCKHFMG
ncbi:MAG: LysR substrate-binding domain-containing protein [Alphaproteobacteria bacterium]|jgi:LysR family glycine cleavage system transcriptional activator